MFSLKCFIIPNIIPFSSRVCKKMKPTGLALCWPSNWVDKFACNIQYESFCHARQMDNGQPASWMTTTNYIDPVLLLSINKKGKCSNDPYSHTSEMGMEESQKAWKQGSGGRRRPPVGSRGSTPRWGSRCKAPWSWGLFLNLRYGKVHFLALYPVSNSHSQILFTVL